MSRLYSSCGGDVGDNVKNYLENHITYHSKAFCEKSRRAHFPSGVLASVADADRRGIRVRGAARGKLGWLREADRMTQVGQKDCSRRSTGWLKTGAVCQDLTPVCVCALADRALQHDAAVPEAPRLLRPRHGPPREL